MDDRHFTYFAQWLDHTLRNSGDSGLAARVADQANIAMAMYAEQGDAPALILAEALERYLAVLVESDPDQ